MTEYISGEKVEVPPHTIEVLREIMSNGEESVYIAEADDGTIGLLRVEHDPDPERFGYDEVEWHPRRASVHADN